MGGDSGGRSGESSLIVHWRLGQIGAGIDAVPCFLGSWVQLVRVYFRARGGEVIAG